MPSIFYIVISAQCTSL